MSTGIHIAGLGVRIGDLVRQRCAWCDAILIDLDLGSIAIALAPGQEREPWHKHVFAPNELVEVTEVEGVRGAMRIPPPLDNKLPLRCCASQRKLVVLPGGDGGA